MDAATERDPKERLIDLDLAKELDSVPSGASHRTGTIQFMAIEVLQGKGHTYRHDLESFFYVFIWMCIRYGHENVGGLEEAAVPRQSRIIGGSDPPRQAYFGIGILGIIGKLLIRNGVTWLGLRT
jgi:hypothetical protein